MTNNQNTRRTRNPKAKNARMFYKLADIAETLLIIVFCVTPVVALVIMMTNPEYREVAGAMWNCVKVMCYKFVNIFTF